MGSEKSAAGRWPLSPPPPRRTGGSRASPRRRARSRRWPTRAPARSACGSATARRWRRRRSTDIERLRGPAPVADRARRGPGARSLPHRLGDRPRHRQARRRPRLALAQPADLAAHHLARARDSRRPADPRDDRQRPARARHVRRAAARRRTGLIARRHPVPGRLGPRRRRRRDGARDLPHLAGRRDLDSVVDIATNLLFVSALTVNLALRDGDAIGWIGGWAVTLSILGGHADRLARARRRRRRSASICSSGPAPHPRPRRPRSTGRCRR